MTNSEPVLALSACAKVNLSLEIRGRRPDGFHEIVSVTQLISLADRIEAWPAGALSIEMQPPVVDDDANLARRAALALADETGRVATGRVRIAKQIPLAAGLGGGSSDAAATLRLLDRVWGTRLGPGRLSSIAASLGSDVPLFLGHGLSLIQGRGELVEPLATVPRFGLLLICPGCAPADKTRALYGALGPTDFTGGSATRALCAWLRDGRSITRAELVNGFDEAASRVYPRFAELRAEISALIGRSVHLSGAGPSLFAVFDTLDEAGMASRQVGRMGLTTFVARSIARPPRIRVVRTT